MRITIRNAQPDDYDAVLAVEAKSTPGLRYVGAVWDLFRNDPTGSWSVAEVAGQVVGCGKYTRLPDGSAWLETLRVIPEFQRRGVGKRLYEHWLALARHDGVTTLRMYTGADNHASKGLAERFGLRVAGHFQEGRLPCPPAPPTPIPEYQPVRDPREAGYLLLPRQDRWGPFQVMNRTYYTFSPALCTHLAERGMVYTHPASHSAITLGARFIPQDTLHIGMLDGDLHAGLRWALALASQREVTRLNIQFPPTRQDVRQALLEYGFTISPADFIVMEVQFDGARELPR